MNLEMFLAMVLAGLLTGWLAGFVMKDGGYGLLADLFLGLVGSSAASATWTLGVSPDMGEVGTVVVALVGAATVIVAQRKVWCLHA
jgi:uncharacterized membrane protein YeaQ/YmgE (transglycosylase-associated protein family)